MGKHLKRLREEKSKVKLKQKKLPKGQNITDASFKVKKIQIEKQLASHDGEIVSSNNKTLKELLNQIQHHNATTQLNSLKDIKVLLNDNPSMCRGLELRQVVSHVLELCVSDREKKVRRASLKLLSDVLTPIPKKTLAPFIDLLNKQLKRGLSHIQADIQRDSLKLLELDLMLSGSKEFHEIRTLLELLLRILTMTVPAAPRINVLRRIHGLCKILLRSKSAKIARSKEVRLGERICEPLTSTYKSFPRLNLDKRSSNSENLLEDIQSLLSKLIPSLLGVWKEYSSDSYVPEGSIELLRIVVDVISLLCEFVDQESDNPNSSSLKPWFCALAKKSISQSLLKHYPYLTTGSSDREKRQSDFVGMPEVPVAVTEMNLSIAKLYYWFKIKSSTHESKIEKYAFDVLNEKKISNEMIDLMEIMLTIKSKQESTLIKLAARYLDSPDPKILKLLCLHVLKPELSYCLSLPIIVDWIIGLVKNLSTASEDRLTVLLALAGRCDNPALQEAVSKEVEAVLNPTNELEALDSRYKQILHIIYWTIPHDQLLMCKTNSTVIENYLHSILSF